MWVPPEELDPVVLHAPTRKNIGVYGAVCARDGRLLVQRAEKFCAESFLIFLKNLFRRRAKRKKMVVVVDNARWHHARLLQPWLKAHKKYLRLDYLPPYSPELNHIERIWKLTRRLKTHNRYFATLEELAKSVFQQFREWWNPNQTLRRLCAMI